MLRLSDGLPVRVDERPDLAARLSVVIVSWNTRDLLERCLSSIYRGLPQGDVQDVRPEVFVVDNASTDGSPEMVCARFPRAHLIANSENVGFARANNQALRRTSGDYVLLLNPDTEAHPGALSALARFLAAHPEVGAVGPRLLNPDQTLQVSCYPEPTLPRELWRLLRLDAIRPYGTYHMAGWSLDRPRQVDVLLGAAILARRSALEQIGLFDEDYFMYSEEVDLCRRLRQAGHEIWWVPHAVVMHYGGQSTRQVALSMFLRLYQGKVIYFRKHQGQTSARIYKVILLLAALTRQVYQALALLESGSRRESHLAIARSYRRLIAALPSM